MQYCFRRCALVCLVICFVWTATAHSQTPREQVGYDQLVAEIGGSLETGAGIKVGQAEAPAGTAYLPDASNPAFAGKTFTDGTGTNVGINSHATGVGARQYGNSLSLSTGVTDITGYDANDWIGRVLGFDASAIPLAQDFSVMNHSYIGNGLTTAEAVEINRRMDFVVNRDNITMVVGANNGGGSATPQIFAQSYNTITVGRTDGAHSHTLTTLNGSGRSKPEIVAPQSVTSNSTPMVASAATLLRHQGLNLGNANAVQNEVTKAVLLAGATKNEFPGWSNSSTQPLDSTFGAGELNIYNSYHILAGGEFDGSTTEVGTPDIADRGWDYSASIADGANMFYNFEVTAPSADASLLLTWNADISDAGGTLDFDTLDLANLDLLLFDSSTSFMGSLVGESISTVDNVEHLFLQGLTTGDYTIAVRSTSGSTDFGFAWNITAVPEPSSLLLLFATTTGVAFRRRRTR